ncbi:MAG: hypothetical protein GXY39_03155 [Actinomycetales bacterium]|nr:hypothetical protein [Tetrasphaera sp.]NLW98683.1 hypothetical protein [Actinomycetales bacterium]
MPVHAQTRRLLDLGLQVDADPGPPPTEDAILAVHHEVVPAADLAVLLRRGDKPGFVNVDMPDLAEFVPVPEVTIPNRPLYWLVGIDRGDDLQSWSPEEAAPELASRGRSPLTVHEGISWLLQRPEVLEPSSCFMTIASRKPKARPKGAYDARTPAIWISGGTGRDGRETKGAPKVGWCWWRNRHTWLGFASVTRRV